MTQNSRGKKISQLKPKQKCHMIQFINMDIKMASINIFHMFKKVEESIHIRNEGYEKGLYKTCKDGKRTIVIPKMKDHTTSNRPEIPTLD